MTIHGGGWVVGNVATNYQFYSNMAAKTGAIVFAPEYRLAPESLYPDGMVHFFFIPKLTS